MYCSFLKLLQPFSHCITCYVMKRTENTEKPRKIKGCVLDYEAESDPDSTLSLLNIGKLYQVQSFCFMYIDAQWCV